MRHIFSFERAEWHSAGLALGLAANSYSGGAPWSATAQDSFLGTEDNHPPFPFSPAQLNVWIQHAIRNDVAVRRQDGAAVTGRTVKITVEIEEC